MCKGLWMCDWKYFIFPAKVTSQVGARLRGRTNMDLAKLAVIVSLLTLISVQLGKS